MLTTDDRERFQRQIAIQEIGVKGQCRLKQARVLIAGAGGLGSPVAIYLAVAGVGELCIVDHDTVALSNLNRQILYGVEDIGMRKADAARQTLKRLTSSDAVKTVAATLTAANIEKIAAGFDVIVDALDNLSTRYVLNQAAISQGVPLIHGAVDGFEGRAMTILPGQSACLHCMHQGRIPEKSVPVIGVTPAVIAGIQATETIKYLTGIGELLNGRMVFYDGLALTFEEFQVKRNPDCPVCGHL